MYEFKGACTVEELKSDYDWDCAIAEAMGLEWGYSDEHKARVQKLWDCVDKVLASEEGENDGRDWAALFLMRDGRYCFLEAGCDYTGWD